MPVPAVVIEQVTSGACLGSFGRLKPLITSFGCRCRLLRRWRRCWSSPFFALCCVWGVFTHDETTTRKKKEAERDREMLACCAVAVPPPQCL